jgi:hypothetical protein
VFFESKADTLQHITFDDCGDDRYCTVDTQNTHPEPEFVNAHKYPELSDANNDILDHHHLVAFANIYLAHAVESSPTPRDYEF